MPGVAKRVHGWLAIGGRAVPNSFYWPAIKVFRVKRVKVNKLLVPEIGTGIDGVLAILLWLNKGKHFQLHSTINFTETFTLSTRVLVGISDIFLNFLMPRDIFIKNITKGKIEGKRGLLK